MKSFHACSKRDRLPDSPKYFASQRPTGPERDCVGSNKTINWRLSQANSIAFKRDEPNSSAVAAEAGHAEFETTATIPRTGAPDGLAPPALYAPDVADVHGLAPVSPDSWPHRGEKGQPLNTIPNLRHLLENYGFTVRYDTIRKDLLVTHPGQRGTADNQRSKAVDTVISLCALNRLPKTDAPSFLLSIGDDNQHNPVMEFITAHPWDGASRFVDLSATVKTRPGFDRDLFELLLKRWLISAVAAAALPRGFMSKGVLVFQGEQSIGKTAWIRALLPRELRDLVKIDASIDPANKDTIISAVSHWLVELGELDGTLRKADIARLKGFISQDVDQFRRPYGRAEEKFARRTVFFASVNPEQFLADDTGNGRWWTVPVDAIDYSHGIDMQQLWAEVLHWYMEGERWWLDREEEKRLEKSNEGYQRADPIDELILRRYDHDAHPHDWRYLTATEILIEMGYDRPTRSQLNEAGAAMRKHFSDWTRSNGRKVFKVPPLNKAFKRKADPEDESRPF
jgi:putative DNA primase/helicase